MSIHREAPSGWAALLAGLAGARRSAMAFLLDHLPASDLDNYPPAAVRPPPTMCCSPG